MSITNREMVANLCISGFCLLMYAWAIPTYTPAYPGYGASPALVANVAVGVMLAMSLLSLTRLLLAHFGNKSLPLDEVQFPKDPQSGGFTQVGRINLTHLTTFLLPCFLLVIAIEYVAYLISAFIFLFVLQIAMGNRNWTQMVAIATIMDGTMYVVMRYGFGVPIPGPQLV